MVNVWVESYGHMTMAANRKKEKRGKKYWIQFTVGYLTDYQSKPPSFYAWFPSFCIWQKPGKGSFSVAWNMKIVLTIWKKKNNVFRLLKTSKYAGGRNQQHMFIILWPGTANSTLNEPADLSDDTLIANPHYNISLPVFVILPVFLLTLEHLPSLEKPSVCLLGYCFFGFLVSGMYWLYGKTSNMLLAYTASYCTKSFCGLHWCTYP